MASAGVSLYIQANVVGSPMSGTAYPGSSGTPYVPNNNAGQGGQASGGNFAALAAGGPELLALTVIVAAAEAAFDALVDTVHQLDDTFNDMAKTASRYNADAAVATSLADVRALFAEMEQANRLGPELAGYVDARARLAETVKKIETDLAEVLIPIAEQVVRFLDGILKGMREAFNFQDIASTILAAINGNPAIQGFLQGWFGMFFQPLIALLQQIANNTAPQAQPAFMQAYDALINPASAWNQMPMGMPQFAPPQLGKP